MNDIYVITDRAARPFYEAMDFGEERVVFVDLAEAHESVGACRVSVMIIDAGSNPDSGLLLLKRLKHCCVTVPVIFLTDASSEEVAISALKAGVRDYFRKPVNRDDLMASIRKQNTLRRSTLDAKMPRTCSPCASDGCGAPGLNPDLPDGILKTVQFLKENLAEKIYLDDMAGKAGMSKFHFCRIFKDHVGMTPMQFLTINRIERAKVLMRKAGTSITSVIYQVGFNDISEFNRQFKKATGQTPSAFRESLKKQRIERHLDN